jgi:CRP-like cAMP-binding protein
MEGEVEVRQDRDQGHAVVARLSRPAAIGELSTLNATAATADVVAVTPVRTLLLPSEVLLELLTQHPRLAIGLLRTLSERLIETTKRLESAAP